MPLAPWESPQILTEALASLSKQILIPAQVVISCDGTPPTELMKVIETADLPTQLVFGPGDEGIGPVLTRGLIECLHDLVIRADADDISVDKRCFVQVCWMRQHPQVIVLGTVISEFHDSPDELIRKRSVPIGSENILYKARSRNPLNHPSVILRRKEIMLAGSYRSKPGFEDYDLWLRILKIYGPSAVANIPDSLVYARVGSAHLNRRHGYQYAVAEFRFYWSCGCDGLLGWKDVLIALALRLPLRLLPKQCLAWAMGSTTRQPLPPSDLAQTRSYDF